MSQWTARVLSAAAGAATILALAGCGLPDGVDGDLTGDWPDFSDLRQMVPEVGVCHNRDYRATVELGFYYQPRDCTEQHLVETVHVSEFTGEAAERDRPPNPGTDIWRAAYAECDRGAAEYLGADFRHGRLWLGVAVPTRAAWEGGARWFSCDLVEERVHHLTHLWPSGNRRGALAAGPSGLTYGCMEGVEPDEDGGLDLWHIDCSEPHEAEFIGVWHADDDRYPTSDRAKEQVFDACYELVAEYVGVSVAQARRVGVAFDHIAAEDWENGDRGFRCYLWVEDGGLTESLAGAGPGGLPAG